MKQKPSKCQYYVVRKLRNLIYHLNACYLIHILSYTQNVLAVGFRTLVSQINFCLPWLCVDMASIMVSWHTCYNSVKVLSTEFFVAWIVFVKAIFSCLNLEPDDGFLPYNTPELFNKTGDGVTGIVIA